MSLKLQIGKRYRRRDGSITANALKKTGSDMYPFSDGIYSYTREGRRLFRNKHPTDLVKEYKPKPKAPEVSPYKLKFGYPMAKGHDQAAEDVEVECLKAMAKFPSFNTAHEGYAVLLEEMDELWAEVKKKQGASGRPEAIRKEAIQVAAMALRLIIDCTDPTKPAYNK